jgi:hypothetical protein
MEGETLNLGGGGGVIPTNASLSSMPIYMMGMYLLHERTHQQMDTIRSKFFWVSDGEKSHYHMVKWENTCGGLESLTQVSEGWPNCKL